MLQSNIAVHAANRFLSAFGRSRVSLSLTHLTHVIVFFIAASGPVRLFTPYKRRRKAQTDESMTSSGNGTTVTITTPPISNNSSSTNLNNNTSIINNNTQQLHIHTQPIQNNISNNNNNTVTINANNGIKKKRFSVNILNVKPSSADSSDDVDAENITFAPSITPAVKEESVAPWQTVSEAIQEISAEYVVDQSCKYEF